MPPRGHADSDKQAAGRDACCCEPRLPEPTELDRCLVEATAAALGQHYEQGTTVSHCTSNRNNGEHKEATCSEAAAAATAAKAKRSKPSLGKRVRHLFGLATSSSSSSSKAVPPKMSARQSQQRQQQAAATQTGDSCRSNDVIEAEGKNTDKDDITMTHPLELLVVPLPGNATTTPAAVPMATSNKNMDETETDSPEAIDTENAEDNSELLQAPQPVRIRVLRGGPTTEGHRRIRDAIFRECRIIPAATLYKKSKIAPGHEKLFLSAPTNPRPVGSRMLYDIARQNFRHHSDCNRDFTRVGLGKICPNYCRPSQFRYVY